MVLLRFFTDELVRKTTLRFPKGLHDVLRTRAAVEHRTVNMLVIQLLEDRLRQEDVWRRMLTQEEAQDA